MFFPRSHTAHFFLSRINHSNIQKIFPAFGNSAKRLQRTKKKKRNPTRIKRSKWDGIKPLKKADSTSPSFHSFSLGFKIGHKDQKRERKKIILRKFFFFNLERYKYIKKTSTSDIQMRGKKNKFRLQFGRIFLLVCFFSGSSYSGDLECPVGKRDF